MKKFLVFIALISCASAQTRLEMKDDFVNTCYSTAISENTYLNEDRVYDYCQCVFEIASHKMTTLDLAKADQQNSKQSKIFLDNVSNSVQKCLYNIYPE